MAARSGFHSLLRVATTRCFLHSRANSHRRVFSRDIHAFQPLPLRICNPGVKVFFVISGFVVFRRAREAVHQLDGFYPRKKACRSCFRCLLAEVTLLDSVSCSIQKKCPTFLFAISEAPRSEERRVGKECR